MGGKSSRQASAAEPVLPPEKTPYPGPPVQHHFLVTEVTMSVGMGGLKSKLDDVIPVLAQQVDQGQQLLTFYRIPGATRMSGLTSSRSPFLAIFRDRASASEERQVLQYIKTHIQSKFNRTGMFYGVHMQTDGGGIFAAVQQQAALGARFICAELTGQAAASSLSQQFRGLGPSMGVDIFFESPLATGTQRFVYDMVSVPLKRKGSLGMVMVECDWMEVLCSRLSQGWRLVEVFYDNSMFLNPRVSRSVTSLNSEWFFEKPLAKLHDPTPLWESRFLEVYIKIKTKFGGISTETGWESHINAMGARGWELACILEMPEMYQTGLATIKIRCILFFQRLILPPVDAPPAYNSTFAPTTQPQPGMAASGYSHAPPPSYAPVPEGYAYGGKE